MSRLNFDDRKRSCFSSIPNLSAHFSLFIYWEFTSKCVIISLLKHYYIHCLVYFGTTTTTFVVVVAPPHQHWTPTGGIYCPDFWIISYIVRKKKKEVGALMKRPLPTSKSRDLLFDITRTPAESPCQKWFLFSLQRARRNECFPCVNEWETFS